MAFPRSAGFRILLAAIVFAVVAGVVGVAVFYVAFVRDLPDLHDVRDYQPSLASTVYDREGRPIGEFFKERRRLTPLSDVPKHVIDAFVAGEDATFFEHAGIDYVSILRAAWVNLRAGGEIKQGASTITQQMVKGLLLTPERNFTRKIREMLLAHRIEQRFSKQDILFLYLNQIYLGHGAYGVGEAARAYFDKDVGELSVSEGAQLAGLPKAPSRYSPVGHPEAAERRRRYVLERMRAEGYLDGAGYEMALADAPVLTDPDRGDFEVAGYFTEEVRRRLFEELGGELVLTGGLEIETTLDLDLERAAVAAVQRGVKELDRRQGYRGPLRQVAAADIAAEIEQLAARNELLPTEGGEPTAELGAGQVYQGIAVEVDVAERRARIAFAPDVTGVIGLRDLRWTRVPKGPLLKSIDQVFAVGDVALFELRPPDDGAETATETRLLLVQEPAAQSALLSLDVATDEVVAMVGGYDFANSEFNRVTQARRQPGSAFKPLIYSAALMKGYTPASILYDRPVVYTDNKSGFVWRPRNYKGEFNGPITMREALARSINNATVHLFRDVGVDFVIDYARMVGIESPLDRDLSLALGSSGVTLFELTRAYATFPSGGRRSNPVFVREVRDRNGEVLLQNLTLGGGVRRSTTPEIEANAPADTAVAELVDVAAAPPEAASLPKLSDEFLAVRAEFGEFEDPDQLISPELAYLTTALLRAVVTDPRGTGGTLRELRRPVAGKTGTTNDQADAWFLGFSPDLVTGVWVGHDEIRFLGYKETGGRAAAPIWRYYMADALRARPARDFPVPDPIVFARVDRTTGLLADVDSKNIVFEAFLPGTEPTERAEAARTSAEGRRMLRLDDF